jgi:hypothetical protein
MEKREYEKPLVITYSEDEILDIIGPAQTCAPSPVNNG